MGVSQSGQRKGRRSRSESTSKEDKEIKKAIKASEKTAKEEEKAAEKAAKKQQQAVQSGQQPPDAAKTPTVPVKPTAVPHAMSSEIITQDFGDPAASKKSSNGKGKAEAVSPAPDVKNISNANEI